jgi:hypothetical protein
VYIKLIDNECVLNLLRATNGQAENKHHTGEISIVTIGMAGMGNKRVRIANLPPEVPDNALKAALTPYGTVLDIQEKKWPRVYRYAVANGIRQVMIMLTRHIPSHITVEGHTVLLSYGGQPTTYYGCGDIGNLYPTCYKRKKTGSATQEQQPNTYASVVAPKTSQTETWTECASNDILQYNTEEPVQQLPITTGTEQQTTELSMDQGEDSQNDNPKPHGWAPMKKMTPYVTNNHNTSVMDRR